MIFINEDSMAKLSLAFFILNTGETALRIILSTIYIVTIFLERREGINSIPPGDVLFVYINCAMWVKTLTMEVSNHLSTTHKNSFRNIVKSWKNVLLTRFNSSTTQ